MEAKPLQLLIISGVSGAGKSQVINYLEDVGFFCIDNLPPYILPSLVESFEAEPELDKLAVVIDIRGEMFLKELNNSLAVLDAKNIHYEIIFMEASNRALVARYKMTRRRHPLIEEAGGDVESDRAVQSLLPALLHGCSEEGERGADPGRGNISGGPAR